MTCFVFVMTLTVLVSAIASKSYRSESKLLVRLGRENVGLDPTAMAGDLGTINVMQSREEEINSVATLLSNRGLAERVVDTVGYEKILDLDQPSESDAGLEQASEQVAGDRSLATTFIGRIVPSMTLSPRDKAIRRLQQRLDVQAISETSLVQISYESHDPELSRQVVAALVDLYLEEHVQLHRTDGSHEFFSEQTKQVRDALTAAEECLRETRHETGLVAPSEQRAALVQQIARLQAQHVDLKGQIAELVAGTETLARKDGQPFEDHGRRRNEWRDQFCF